MHMKLKISIMAIWVASAPLMAQPFENENKKEQQEAAIAELELELLAQYSTDEGGVKAITLVFYNAEFNLVKEVQVDYLGDTDEEIEHLILQSTLLLDEGKSRIYQIKK